MGVLGVVRLGDPVDDHLGPELGGKGYRAVGTRIFSGAGSSYLVALVPRDHIDAAVRNLRERFLIFALIALIVVALLAYALGRTIVSALAALADALADAPADGLPELSP